MVAIPQSAQISNFISAAKRKNFGAVGEVSLQTLQLSVEKFRNVPANIDEAYVLGAFRGGFIRDRLVDWTTIMS